MNRFAILLGEAPEPVMETVTVHYTDHHGGTLCDLDNSECICTEVIAKVTCATCKAEWLDTHSPEYEARF